MRELRHHRKPKNETVRPVPSATPETGSREGIISEATPGVEQQTRAKT